MANTKTVRLMFEDEAAFGRINKPKYCWCDDGIRPIVPSQHIREYRYTYGSVEPLTGDSFFLVLPYNNSDCMNIYLDNLSKHYIDDHIVLVCDRGSWHTSKILEVPENIQLFYIPPATPEMNPIEQIWKELRKGFKNELFRTLENVVERLCDLICSITKETIKSIAGREWVLNCICIAE